MTVEERIDELEAQSAALNLLIFAAFGCLRPDEVNTMLSTIKEALQGAEGNKAGKILAHIETVHDSFRRQAAGRRQILLEQAGLAAG